MISSHYAGKKTRQIAAQTVPTFTFAAGEGGGGPLLNIANKRREENDIQFGFACGGIVRKGALQSIKQHLCLIYAGFHSSECAISIILV